MDTWNHFLSFETVCHGQRSYISVLARGISLVLRKKLMKANYNDRARLCGRFLTCGRFYNYATKEWMDHWHPPGICDGCDSIRATRSLNAGLERHNNILNKLPADIQMTIIQFIDWWEIYETNLKQLDSVIPRLRRLPTLIEVAAYEAATKST